MVPYVPEPALEIGSVRIPAFWLLMFLGAAVGYEVVVRRAEGVGLDRARTATLAAWTLLLGFVGSWLFAEILLGGGISSFGGMLSGIAGAVVIARRRRMGLADGLRFLDLVAFAAPFAWTFGRAGCALAHDHLGIPSSHWLAVRFPQGPRFDVGLLEAFVHAPLAILFAWLGRHRRPPGFFLGLFFSIYGPVRFALETLRVGETRYLGWTPNQFVCVIVGVAGAALWLRAVRSSST